MIFSKCRNPNEIKGFQLWKNPEKIVGHSPKAGALPTALHPDIVFIKFFQEVRCASCCNIVVSLVIHFAILLVAPLLFPRCIRHWRRSETSPTALHPEIAFVKFGAGDRGRTGTVSLPLDFESSTSANSITPANITDTLYYKVSEKSI